MTGWRLLLGLGIAAAVILVAARSVLISERAIGSIARPAVSASGVAATPAVQRKRVKVPPPSVGEPPTPVPLDCEAAQGVAATVDDRAINVAQVCDRLRFLTGGTSPAAGRQVLDQLIEAELFIGALEDRGIPISEADISAELSKLTVETGVVDHAAPADVARSELKASAHERVARRMLVDAIGRLEPSAADLRAAVPRAQANATVEAWIARLPGNASNEASTRAQKSAAAGLESLQRGEEPLLQGLTQLPSFDLAQGSGEAALEAVVFAPGGSQWQQPVRTRAGWVVARAISIERARPSADQQALRAAAVARVRQREERRILDELRTAATIVRLVQ